MAKAPSHHSRAAAKARPPSSAPSYHGRDARAPEPYRGVDWIKVNSKYNKVEVAPRRSSHQDGRDQNESGCSWKRARIEDTENSGLSIRAASPAGQATGESAARTGREVVEGCQPAHAAHG